MKILIIGGTGNISRWLVPMLVADGHQVTLFNRGQTSAPIVPHTKTILGDRCNHRAFENQMARSGMFDCVVDMVGYEPEDALSAVRAFSGKTGQFIFCSTIDVLTKHPLTMPVRVDAVISASPSFPYAWKKARMENILTEAQGKGGLPLTIIRPAATYSEGWSPLVTCFGGDSYHLDRIRKKMPVILHGDGSGIWTASHSTDVAGAFRNAAGNKNTIGNAYNVAGDEIMTWRAMHRIVAAELGNDEPDFVCIPTDILARLAPRESEWCVENFQYSIIVDNAAAKRDLGFKYTVSYREGAHRCLQYLLQNDLIGSSENHPFYDEVINKWRALIHKI